MIKSYTIGLLLTLAIPVAFPTAMLLASDHWEIRFGVVEPPVVSQRDITINKSVRWRHDELKPIESSGVAWLDGDLVITSDRHAEAIYRVPLNLQTLEIGDPTSFQYRRPFSDTIDDAESIAIQLNTDGSAYIYLACSMSNDRSELPLPTRRYLMRYTMRRNNDEWIVHDTVRLDASPLRELINTRLLAAGIQPYRTYNPDFNAVNKNTYRWGNIEGIQLVPDAGPNGPAIIGMKNPLDNGRAILGVVNGFHDALASENADKLLLSDMFTLNLGGRGISDISWDPVTRGYLISAAISVGPKLNNDQPYPPSVLHSALYWWSGIKEAPPILFAKSANMTVEGICRIGNTPYIALVSDEADESEARPIAQSVVTILEFTGIPSRLIKNKN